MARRTPRSKWNDERFAVDAPVYYSADEARAWAAGYNAAAAAARQAAQAGRAGREERERLR